MEAQSALLQHPWQTFLAHHVHYAQFQKKIGVLYVNMKQSGYIGGGFIGGRGLTKML